MADLDLDAPELSVTALTARFFFSKGALGSKPRCEEVGWVKVVLKIADYLGGGDGGRLVDRFETLSARYTGQ